MVSLATEVPIGTGAYTVHEVACFARMHTVTVRRWFFGTNMGKPVVAENKSSDRFLTFIDFVQALAVRNLRINYHVALPTIRESLDYAKKEFNWHHPFATRHATYLDGKKIIIHPPGMSAPLHAAGRGKGQQVMKPILEAYLREISFDPASGLATQYVAFEYKHARVLMEPTKHFGQPYVESAGITAKRLSDAVAEEGGFEQAAGAFGVEVDEVIAAYRFIDDLQVA